jgi:tRNA A-37 threonylcarbamoyl transferase component Bud32
MGALSPEPMHLEVHRRGPISVYLVPVRAGRLDLDDLFRLPSLLSAIPGDASRQTGRVTSWLWRPRWHDGPGLRVRQYAHGGPLGRLTGTAFLGCRRMLNELRVAAHAYAHGVPTPPPVALRVERTGGLFVRAHLITENIPDAVNLLELLALAERRAPSEGARRRLCHAVADAVAAMHDAGIVHADLNLKNLLIVDAFDAPRVLVIDFDRSCLRRSPSLRERLANLQRLDRSVLKWAASRRAATLRDRLRTLRCYLTRYEQWRAGWGRTAGRCSGGSLPHRLTRERG